MANCCTINFTIEEQLLNFEIENSKLSFTGDLGYVVGTQSYNSLSDKPQINDITLIGNKTSEDLRLQGKMNTLSVQEIEKILYLG